jgi:uncharacterized protein (UPF0335 family)
MNIKQALKRKNKLVKEISSEFEKLQKYNSVVEGMERVYEPQQAMDNYIRKTNQLIALKTAVHRANAPVYDKIFRLAELKSVISQVKRLDCQSGTVHSRGGYGTPSETIVMTAIVSIIERDQLVEKLEAEIEMIQDDLDRWNATTEIDWTE